MNTKLHTSLSSQSVEALENFSENIDIPRLKINLRNVLFEYLRVKHYELIPDFEHFMEDVTILFNFLDTLENEEGDMCGKDI